MTPTCSPRRSRLAMAGLCVIFAATALAVTVGAECDAFAFRRKHRKRKTSKRKTSKRKTNKRKTNKRRTTTTRRSRAGRRAEAARRKAEEERKRAKIERMAAEEERKRAETAAAEARRQAQEAKRQLEAFKAASARSSNAAPGAAPDARPRARPSASDRAKWEGFFMSLNVGYATSGGEEGPLIPDPKGIHIPGGFEAWHLQGCKYPSLGQVCYDRFITTDKGAGLAAALQIGYNIKGYVSFWADLSWHGSFGDKTDLAGAGAGAFLLGLHPLRFWRPDAPVDLRLYGGYGLYEVLYYYEKEGKQEAEGKSWTGTMIPFGLMAEVAVGDIFAIGLDLRAVAASYSRWIYNWDKDIVSELRPPQTTFRFEPRLTLGWHF